MQQVDGRGQVDLPVRRSPVRRYVDTMYRYWYLVIIPILVLPVMALGVSKLTKAGSNVAMSIYVSPDSMKQLGYADPMATPATNGQAALQQLFQTRTFDVAVAKGSPLYWATIARKPDPVYEATSDLSSHVKITVNGPNLIGITYTSKSAAAGLQLLQSILTQAPREIVRLEQRTAVSSTTYYTRQVKAIRARLARDTEKLGTYAQAHNIRSSDMATQALFDPQFAALYQAVQSDQTDLHNAQQQLSQVTTVAAAGSTIQVFDPPSVLLSSQGKKSLLLNLGVGLIVGLLLSGAFVVVTTARDHSVRSASDLVDQLGLPVLATIPYADSLASGPRELPVTRRKAKEGASA